MNKKYFIDLLNYNFIANKKVGDFFCNNHITEGKETELFSHIINAEIIWFKRVTGNSEIPGHMEVYTLGECEVLIKSINTEWINYINSKGENLLSAIIEYKNIKEEQCKSTVWEILTHMINHSSYHRGQISLLIRQKGMKPPATDYIGYSGLRDYKN